MTQQASRGSPLRVMLADDHPLVRDGLAQLLELDPTVTVVGRAGDAEQLMALLVSEAVDVVVTDIRMPPGHHVEGIDAAHRIRSEYPSVGVVVLSAYADESYAHELFRDGTSGLAYLLKDRVADHAELVRAIATVAVGGSVVDPLVVESMVRRRQTHASRLDRLTPRERHVLSRMAAGLSNPAISAELYLSVSAVEKHITSIFTKLELTEEQAIHRRVAAAVTFLAERDDTPKN
ncbi:MAG: response regulator transcription factor [Mycobacteriaceae bacterium]